MDWLNIHTSTLDSAEFVGSTPTERSTWLCLLRYCLGQENGGRIADARGKKDRQWQQLARVTLREVLSDSDLWSWDGDDLVVWRYPVEKEAGGARTGRDKRRRRGIQPRRSHGVPGPSQGARAPTRSGRKRSVRKRGY